MRIFSRKTKPISLTYLMSREAQDDEYEVQGQPYRLVSVVAIGEARTGLSTNELQLTFVRTR